MRTILIFACLASYSLNAQTKNEAIKKTEFERYEEAENDFRVLIENTEDATLFYYFGNNFLNQNLADSALKYYEQGKRLYPNEPLNFIGLGKVALLNKTDREANEYFTTALSITKNKRPDLNRELARAYIDFEIKSPDNSILQIEKAIKLEPKNSFNYIILGDAQLEKNPENGSMPIKNYKKATALNPKSIIGILKEGKLYQRGRNYQLALDKYKEAIAIDSNFAPAYREMAELYTLANQPKKSIENWKKYLAINNSNYAHYRFLSALFSNKQYTDAINEYEWLQKQDYRNLYSERLAAYSYYEMGDKTDRDAYAKGLITIMRFFDMAGDDFKYISSDFKYKGLLLLKNGNDKAGRISLKKAIELDKSTESAIRSELSAACMQDKNYDCVINQLQIKMNIEKGELTNGELFDLGRAYYYSANSLSKTKQTNTEQEKEYDNKLLGADTVLAKLCQKTPNWPYGFIWRARTNSLRYPNIDNDIAKKLYETSINILEKDENKKNAYLVEAYEYLGYYYVVKKDKQNADLIWNKIKVLQPENKKQKEYFKHSKKR